MDVRKFHIEATEHPDAPPHRRWQARVQLVDGRTGAVHGESPEALFEAFMDGAFADLRCDAPGCREVCSSWDLCPACGAVICPDHDSQPFTRSHPQDFHWSPPILLRLEP